MSKIGLYAAIGAGAIAVIAGSYFLGRADGQAKCENRFQQAYIEQVEVQIGRANQLNRQLRALREETAVEISQAQTQIEELEKQLEEELARDPEVIIREIPVEREDDATPTPRFDCRMSDAAFRLRQQAIARTAIDGRD